MSLLRPPIRDHRDQAFRLFVPRRPLFSLLLGPSPSKPIADRLERRFAKMGVRHVLGEPAWIEAMWLLIVVGTIVLTWRSYSLSVVGLMILLIAIPHIIAPTFAVRNLRLSLARAFLEERICPACAYPLDGVAEVDAFTTCPECGAAWIIPRAEPVSSTRSHAPASVPPAAAGFPPTPDR